MRKPGVRAFLGMTGAIDELLPLLPSAGLFFAISVNGRSSVRFFGVRTIQSVEPGAAGWTT